MHRLPIIIVALTVFAAACSNDEPDRSSAQNDSTATGAPAAAATPVTTTGGQAASQSPARARPLANAERIRLRSIAASVERAVALFDRSIPDCPKEIREGCADRAWAVLVSDLDWPPYYLTRMAARTRGCERLAVAAADIYGFNLAVRQIDPGDDATQTRSLDYVTLVNRLRPIPDELRAAASRCR